MEHTLGCWDESLAIYGGTISEMRTCTRTFQWSQRNWGPDEYSLHDTAGEAMRSYMILSYRSRPMEREGCGCPKSIHGSTAGRHRHRQEGSGSEDGIPEGMERYRRDGSSYPRSGIATGTGTIKISDYGVSTELYNKLDDFNFPVVKYAFPESNMPLQLRYNVFFGQVLQYSDLLSQIRFCFNSPKSL